MALEFDVDVVGSEDAGEAGENFGGVFVLEAESERTFVASGEADQAFGEFGRNLRGGGGLVAGLADFGACAQFHAGDEAAEILVARARLDEEGVASAVVAR